MNIINGASLDHLVYESCQAITRDGYEHSPRTGEKKWQTLALNECYLTLKNPRNRLFQYPVKHLNIFELVGRFIWEISGRDDLESILYYSNKASDYAVNGRIHTAYGKRIFGNGIFIDKFSQYNSMIGLLRKDPSTRRAVIMILDKDDDIYTDQEYPCIISLHFYLENNGLNLNVNVRSESAYRIMPMDIFLFTMIHEITSIILNKKLGRYSHFVNNLHIYKNEKEQIEDFLSCKNSYLIKSMEPISDESDYLEELIYLEKKLRLADFGNDLANIAIRIHETLNIYKYKDVFNQFKILLILHKYLKKENCDYIPLYLYNKLIEPYKTLVKNYVNYRKPNLEIL